MYMCIYIYIYVYIYIYMYICIGSVSAISEAFALKHCGRHLDLANVSDPSAKQTITLMYQRQAPHSARGQSLVTFCLRPHTSKSLGAESLALNLGQARRAVTSKFRSRRLFI